MNNEKRWIRKASFVYLSTMVIMLGAAFIQSYLAQQLNLEGEAKTAFLMGSFLLLPWIFALPVIIFILREKLDIKSVLRFRKFRVSDLLFAWLALFFFRPILSWVNLLTIKLGATNYVSDTLEMVGGIGTLPLLIAVAFLPAVLEELQFRSVYYGVMRRMGFFKAGVLTAFLFALLHLNLNQFAYAFLLGLIFAYLTEATDSVIPAMILHFMFNASSVLLLRLPAFYQSLSERSGDAIYERMAEYVHELIQQETQIPTWAEMFGVGFFVSGIMACIGILLLRKIAKRNGKNDLLTHYYRSGDVGLRTFFGPCGIAGILLGIVLMMGLF